MKSAMDLVMAAKAHTREIPLTAHWPAPMS